MVASGNYTFLTHNFEGRVIAFTNYSMEMHIVKKSSVYEHNIKENECNVIIIMYETLFFKSSIIYCIVCIGYIKLF